MFTEHPDLAAANARVAILEAEVAALKAKCREAGETTSAELIEDLEVAEAALSIARKRRSVLANAVKVELRQMIRRLDGMVVPA